MKSMLTFALLLAYTCLAAQPLSRLHFSENNPLVVSGWTEVSRQKHTLTPALPLFSFELNRRTMRTDEARFLKDIFEKTLSVRFVQDTLPDGGIRAKLVFKNLSKQEILLNNIVPFGVGNDHISISGKSAEDTTRIVEPAATSDIPKLFNPFTNSPDTSRSFLFRPGYSPVGVVVPHNNQDLTFCAVELGEKTLYGLVRRSADTIQNYLLIRSPVRLQPGQEVEFFFYADLSEGGWHEALRDCFQQKMLFDRLPGGDFAWKNFDRSLYDRIPYIRHTYSLRLAMAWDKDFIDPGKPFSMAETYQPWQQLQQNVQSLYGGDDVFILWSSWPVLGLDQRNQWELMEDLPGELDRLPDFLQNGRFFISYNPWDDATEEAGLRNMTAFLKRTRAQGVVLDTKAESSEALQAAADAAQPGIVLYSEGMAVPKDMQGILAGRVHNDIYHVPLLNLNKFINPEFAIFRVVEVARERVRREYATALFNGYGVEINTMRPGRPEWMEEDYRFWGKCIRILRENGSRFTSKNFTPLIPTLVDSIYVNRWGTGGIGTIYTIFSLRPEGYRGLLFPAPFPADTGADDEFHYVDLWNHEEVSFENRSRQKFARVDIEPFDRKYLGTNNEGSAGVIARLPLLPMADLKEGTMEVIVPANLVVRVWEGDPSYQKSPLDLTGTDTVVQLDLLKTFGRIGSKYVVQLFQDNELLDEQILRIPPGTPVLVSKIEKTPPLKTPPPGMVEIPAGTFEMHVTNGDEFISYPKAGYPKVLTMSRFFMDKHPVTNRQFKTFLDASGYQPPDTSNFLKHWKNRNPPAGQEDCPVVNVSYEDAQAYANWAGKRLPTEAEWQYAAQTSDGRRWPWGHHGEEQVDGSTKVSATFRLDKVGRLDPALCNTGNGKPDPVGSYPGGVNPFGLQDLVGSIWQMTNDWYQSDTYGYLLLKGGSYYHPGGSWWYVQGGPKPLSYRQMLLRVSQGFERNATVGFRCVADAER